MDKKALMQIIGQMNKDELLDLIRALIKSNPDTEETLLLFCQKKLKPDNRNLVNEKLLLKHWQNALGIISDANCYGGCSDMDEQDAFYELDELSKLVQQNDFSWSCRKPIVNEMLEQVALDNSSFTDVLVDTAEVLCKNAEEQKYLAGFLAEKGNSYYKKYAAIIFEKLGDFDQSLLIRKANLEYASDYIEVASYYDKHGDHQTALQVVLDGLNNCPGRLDDIYTYLYHRYEKDRNEKALWDLFDLAVREQRSIDSIAELMYTHCKKRADYPNQKRMLHLLVETCSRDSVMKWYEQCRQDLSEDDWQKDESRFLDFVKRKDIKAYLDICLAKGDKKKVLEYVINAPVGLVSVSADVGHRYSKMLVRDYPQEILQHYWQEVHTLIRLGKNQSYQSAASVLKEIKAIMKKNLLADQWDMQFAELKVEYGRRRNFLREIEKL